MNPFLLSFFENIWFHPVSLPLLRSDPPSNAEMEVTTAVPSFLPWYPGAMMLLEQKSRHEPMHVVLPLACGMVVEWIIVGTRGVVPVGGVVPIGHTYLLAHLLLLQGPAAVALPAVDAPHLSSMGLGHLGASEMLPWSLSYILKLSEHPA